MGLTNDAELQRKLLGALLGSRGSHRQYMTNVESSRGSVVLDIVIATHSLDRHMGGWKETIRHV